MGSWSISLRFDNNNNNPSYWKKRNRSTCYELSQNLKVMPQWLPQLPLHLVNYNLIFPQVARGHHWLKNKSIWICQGQEYCTYQTKSISCKLVRTMPPNNHTRIWKFNKPIGELLEFGVRQRQGSIIIYVVNLKCVLISLLVDI